MNEQTDQIDALARAMSTMPGLDPSKSRTPVNAAVRRLWATELITKWGVSIDPEAATVEAVNETPALGNIGHHKVQARAADRLAAARAADNAAGEEFIRRSGADFLAANRPDLAARLAAAKTPAQRHALAEELKTKILNDPNTLVTDFIGLIQDGS